MWSSCAMLIVCMCTVSASAWQFEGLFQVADSAANCTRCSSSNPVTNACSCPSLATLTGTLRALTHCAGSGTLSGTDVALCGINDFKYTDGVFGGVFQLDDAVVGSLGCRSPNPATGACNCPFLFREIPMRVLVDTPDSPGRVIGSTVGFCINTTADQVSWFGGAYQVLDNGGCAISNPVTQNCSCPSSSYRINRFRAISDGPEGSFVDVCVPVLPPPPRPPSSSGSPVYIYVSTTGSDANNNGTSPTSPLLTIARALDVVAELRVVDGGRNVTIRVSEGVYPQSSTLRWGQQSCGSRTANSFVSLEAFPAGARVVVSGGIDITSRFVRRHEDAMVTWYSTATLADIIPQEFVWQLWRSTNDSTAPSYARVPLVAEATESYKALLSAVVPITFELSSGAPAPPYPADPSSSYVVMYHSWTSTTNALSGYDPLTRIVTVAGAEPDNVYNAASGNRYRFVNLPPGFLTGINNTSGGQATKPWTYYMNKTSKEVFLAVPKNVTTLPTIILPLLGTVLSVQGPRCANVMIKGITVAHTDSFLQEQCLATGCSGQSGAFLSGAGVEISNQVTQAFLENITIAHTGGYALWIHGATNSIIVNRAHIHDLGAGGVRIGEAASGQISDRSLLATNIQLRNSIIHDGGYIVEAGTGVLLQQAASCTIANNAIFDLYYTGVSTGWNWGYAPTSNNNIIVHYNLMYNLGRGVLSDMGCIYNLGTSPGTIMDHNVCHDLQSFGYGGWGLYSDEGTSLVTWTNNIVYRTKSAPYHQHYGMNNLVKNNVFAFPQVTLGQPLGASNGDFAAVRSSPAYSGPEHETSFTLSTNIMLLRNASATLFYSTIEEAFINVTANDNVYYNTAEDVSALTFPCFRGDDPLQCSLAQWQALGEDIQSAAANPLFLDADNYNFSSLAAASPALQRSFVPIDTDNVGPSM